MKLTSFLILMTQFICIREELAIYITDLVLVLAWRAKSLSCGRYSLEE